MWELDCEESWAPKNWCFWTVVLEKTLESPLDCKEIQPVLPKGDQSWVFIGRTDAEAETPIFWPPHGKSWLIGKDPNAGRDCGQEEKGMTEDEMAGWHHQLDAHESEWTLGAGDGQRGLVCCDSWGRKESDTTERLNWTELKETYQAYLIGQWVKTLPATQETWFWSLGWEDPLDQGVAIPIPAFLPGEIPMNRGAWQATVHRVMKNWTRLSDWPQQETYQQISVCGLFFISFWTEMENIWYYRIILYFGRRVIMLLWFLIF